LAVGVVFLSIVVEKQGPDAVDFLSHLRIVDHQAHHFISELENICGVIPFQKINHLLLNSATFCQKDQLFVQGSFDSYKQALLLVVS
jgi:hypothetical protein